MPHPFHYFIPNASSTSWCLGGLLPADRLKEHRLEHLTHLAKPGQAAICDAQIEGVNGLLFTPNLPGGKFAEQISYSAATQTWLKASGKAWIGWETNDLPTPELLQKKDFIQQGYVVRDGADRGWTIPVARSPRVGGVSLPCDVQWNVETGEPSLVRKAQHDYLWQLAGELHDYFANPGVARDDLWLERKALICLQANYTISPLELEAFRTAGSPVLDQERAMFIAMALFDMQIVNEVEDSKKN